MDVCLKELKNQYSCIQSKNFFIKHSELNDKVAVIVEPRKLEIFPYVVYNVMYNLGPDWNLHVFAHDKDFVETSLKNSEYKLNIISKDTLMPSDYNTLFQSVDFWNNIKEENILIFQTDSCIINPIPNINKYLNYPFIGGIYQFSCQENQLVKNIFMGYTHDWCLHANQIQLNNTPYHHYSICGGFSFRKKSAMLDCIKKVDRQKIIDYRGNFGMNIHYYENVDVLGEDTFFQHALEILNYELPKIDSCINFCENLCYKNTCLTSFSFHNINKIDDSESNRQLFKLLFSNHKTSNNILI